MLFGHPELLKLLWALPVLAALAVAGAWLRRRRLRAWGEEGLWDRLAPGRTPWLRGIRVGVALLALALAMVAAARPQVGASLVQVERQGIDVVVALDVSLSMEASDVVPSRLDRSRLEIRELFSRLGGDRMGVVIFAGSAFTLCPLTVDVSAANLFLDAVDVDVLPDPGTNLEQALEGALRAFGEEEFEGRGKAVVLFTDGEGHDGDPFQVLEAYKTRGIPVLTVGVGTPNGEPIPVRDADGRTTGYKRDRSNEVVLSRLDEAVLKRIAVETGGRYYPATLQGHEVEEMATFLGHLEKGELGSAFRRRVEERFQIPVGIALVLLALALLTPEARRAPGMEL